MEIISVPEIKKQLNTKIVGQEIIFLDETVSTNLYAKEMVKNGAKEGLAVIASCQKGGKGRMGRSFFSPKDKGIYMSLCLCPDLMNEKGLLITLMAALAAARGIDKICKTETQIKWVNDIYLGGKKVCGILAESCSLGENAMGYVVLGIGINVKKAEFPADLEDIATSIENETGKEVSINALIAGILNEIDRLYADFKSGEFLKEYKEKSMVLGKEIKVIRGNECYFAKALDIDECGGLVLEASGKKEVLMSGEVSIRLKD